MKKSLIFTLIVLICIVSTLVACSEPESTTTAPAPSTTAPAPTTTAPAPTTTAPEPDEPKSGGVLKIITGSTPSNFGYTPTARGGSALFAFTAMENLVTLDENYLPAPELATDWEWSADGKTLTMNLREGVKFHDGTPFNAEAVKWNYDERIAVSPASLPGLTSVDIIDNYTIQLNVKEFSNIFLESVAFSAIGSPTWLQEQGEEGSMNHPVGTGPFSFKEFKREAYMKFERFDDHWGGKPYLDEVEYVFIADDTVARMSFEAGEGHVLWGVAAKDAYELKQKGYNIVNYPAGMRALIPDSKNAESHFANKLVREAISHAIDNESLVDALGWGIWEPLTQLCHKAGPGYNPDYEGRAYDPDKARQLLQDAGLGDGFETKVVASTVYADRDAVTYVQDSLKDINIVVEVDYADQGRYNEHKFGSWSNSILMSDHGWSNMVLSALNRIYSETSVIYPSLARPEGWQDLHLQAMAARSPEEANSLTRQMIRLAADECMVMPIYLSGASMAMQESVHDSNIGVVHFFHWSEGKAWLSE